MYKVLFAIGIAALFYYLMPLSHVHITCEGVESFSQFWDPYLKAQYQHDAYARCQDNQNKILVETVFGAIAGLVLGSIADKVTTEHNSSNQPKTQTRHCVQCGAENEVADKFCIACGVPLFKPHEVSTNS